MALNSPQECNFKMSPISQEIHSYRQQNLQYIEFNKFKIIFFSRGTNKRIGNFQAIRSDQRHRQRSGSTNSAAGRPKSWRPSLQSISEAGS